MNKKTYQVVTHGELVDGRKFSEVLEKLMAFFKQDKDEVMALLSGKRVEVLTRVFRDTAEVYRDQLQEAGLLADIEEMPLKRPLP